MDTGFAVYQKKQEFGNAELHINDFTSLQTDSVYILEEGSRLILNASEMKFNSHDALKSLYEQKMEMGPS